MDTHFLDSFSLVQLFFCSMLLMLVFLEAGYRIATRPSASKVKAQTSQVRALMGAALGLTAFMLAFTFAVAQSHYETRMQGMVEEARIARHAFMEADLLTEPQRSQIRDTLKQYTGRAFRAMRPTSSAQARGPKRRAGAGEGAPSSAESSPIVRSESRTTGA